MEKPHLGQSFQDYIFYAQFLALGLSVCSHKQQEEALFRWLSKTLIMRIGECHYKPYIVKYIYQKSCISFSTRFLTYLVSES